MIRRIFLSAAAACLALSACQTRAPETPRADLPAAAKAPEPQAGQPCHGLRRFASGPGANPAAFSPTSMDESHVSVRGTAAGVRPAGDLILRTRIGGGPPSPELTEESSIVHRDSTGVWRISRVEFYPYAIPELQWEAVDGQTPQPVAGKSNRRVIEGALPEAIVKLIEAALAEPCFREDAPPPPRPPRNAPEAPCPPDSSGYLLEIIENGRSRFYSQSCHATWSGASLLSLVAGSYPELRDPPAKP